MSEVLWRTASAKVAARSGQVDQAQRLSAEAVAKSAGTDFLCLQGDALLDHADVLAYGQRTAEALAAVGRAAALYEQKGDAASVGRARAMQLLLCG